MWVLYGGMLARKCGFVLGSGLFGEFLRRYALDLYTCEELNHTMVVQVNLKTLKMLVGVAYTYHVNDLDRMVFLILPR